MAGGLGSTMVDFKKQLGRNKSFAKLTHPIEIYETLDRASDKGPLRPAQKAILEEWHQQRRTQGRHHQDAYRPR